MLLSTDRALAGDVTSGVLFRKALSRVQAAGWVCGMLTCVLIAGCDNGASSRDATDDSHLKIIADSYSLFLKNNRRLPKDDTEFREFVTQRAAEDPRAEGQTIDQLLTSPRDRQPYVLLTEQNAPSGGSIQAAYEQEGVNGRRLIADTAGNIQEVDEATFRTLVPDSP
jgi:hypothetical protein